MEVELREDEIVVEENSGGVHPDDLLAFVQLGGESPVKEALEAVSIGVWGSGQKQALGRLAYDHTITTHYWDSRKPYSLGTPEHPHYAQQIEIRTDRGWWFSDDWNIPVCLSDEQMELGSTRFVIRALNTWITEDVIERVREELADMYGDLLRVREGEIEILINGKLLQGEPHLTEEAIKRTFAFPPGLEPARHVFDVWFETWEPGPSTLEALKVDHSLRIEIIVGLTPRADKENAGVYVFGTPTSPTGCQLGPRMFAQNLQDESVGYVEPGAKLPAGSVLMRKNDPLLGRLRMYVNLCGASLDNPWGMPGSPVKKGLNAAHPAAAKIREAIVQAAAPFVRVAPKAREIDILPFSLTWNERPEMQKLTLIQRSAEIDASDLQLNEVQEQIKPLVEYQFDPAAAVIHEWDHARSGRPPETVATFDEKLARQVASKIDKGEKDLERLRGDDPQQAVKMLLETLPLQAAPSLGEEAAVAEPTRGPYVDPEATQVVSIRLKTRVVHDLMRYTGKRSKGEAVTEAVRMYLEAVEAAASEPMVAAS